MKKILKVDKFRISDTKRVPIYSYSFFWNTEVLRTESYIDQSDSLNLTPLSQLREKDTPSSPLSPSSSYSFSAPLPPSLPSVPTSSPIKEQCTYPNCQNTAHNFFKTVRLNTYGLIHGLPQWTALRRSNIFLCYCCLNFVPLQDLKRNPPGKT